MEPDSFKKVKFYQRQLIINKQVQTGIIGYSVFLVFAVLIGQFLLQSLVFSDHMEDSGFTGTHFIVYSVIFIFFILVILYGMYLTNQIAGPIHRLKVHLDDVKAGKEIADLTFRKGDYFREVLEPYNHVIKNNLKK